MRKAGEKGSRPGGERGFEHRLVEGESGIRVVADFPGIGEERIHIDLDEKVLTISVDGKGRRYRKAILLPCDARLGRKRFSQGVLEIFLEKAS